MKNVVFKLVLPSLLLGIVITALFTSANTWIPQKSCWEAYNNTLPSSVRRVDCSNKSYGYPLRFVTSSSVVSVNAYDTSKNSPALIGVSSRATIDMPNTAIDLALWSAASFAVLYALYTYKNRAKSK